MKPYTLFDGKLITDEAFIVPSHIIAFQANVVILENGETIKLADSLATALKAYLKDTRQRLEHIQ